MPLYTARDFDADLRDAQIHDDGSPTNTLVIDAPDADLARRALATYLWARGRLSAARLVACWTITQTVPVYGPRRAPQRPDSHAYRTEHLSGDARTAAEAIVAFLREKNGRALRTADPGIQVFWSPEAWNAQGSKKLPGGEVSDPNAVLILAHPDRRETEFSPAEGDLSFLADTYAHEQVNDLDQALEPLGYCIEADYTCTVAYRIATDDDTDHSETP